jgi:AsmA protein
MKRFFWAIAALAVLIGAGLLAVPHLVPRDVVKTRIAEQISAWTGRAVSLRGEPVIALFPRPTVSLSDVRIAGPEGMRDADLVWMEQLTGSIRLLPLILGQVEIETFEIVRPRVRLVRDETGRRNWTFDAGAAALQLAFAGDVRLGEFLLEDGEVVYEDRAEGLTEKLQAVDLALDWPSVRRPLALSGTAVWRGENVAIEGSARDPFSFLKGGRTPVEARLEAKPLRASLQGEANNEVESRFVGALTVESPSLRRLLNWLGNDLPPGSTLAAMRLSGNATLDRAALSVDQASFSLDGNDAAGALQVAFEGTPHVSGTLAFPSLDLGPYFEGLRDEIDSNGEDWQSVGIDTDWFRMLNSDVRLSAERLSLGRLALNNAALSVLLKEGRLELGLAQAGFYGGSMSGTFSLMDAANGPGAVSEAQLRASDFNLSEVRSSLGIAADLSGISTVAVDLKTAGETLGQLVAGLEGTVAVGAAQGTLPPLGLDAVAAALRTGNIPAPADPAQATAFERLQASLGFAEEAAVLQQAALDTSAYAAVMSGQIALRTGAVALRGALSLAGSDGPAAPFMIDGTLGTPTVRMPALGGN